MLKINHLYKTFYYNKKPIFGLKNIHIEIQKKDIFGLLGHTGSGKTTLLNIMNGIVLPDPNPKTIINKNFDLLESATIFQNLNLLTNLNVFQNIALPLKIRKKNSKEIEEKVLKIINFLELNHLINTFPKNLSGGQKQKVAIARALVYQPKIIFCDEPTSALDQINGKNILKLLWKINKIFKTTIVIISHDIYVIKTLCNKIAFLQQGEIKKKISFVPSYDFRNVSYDDFF
ncbi:ATP-binding cassette domain-containing protein [Candidatus Phytoplasma pini]|uniref:Methionine transport ATP-binding protein n=1 Tax=Candidatus Phytoplasma pini TaxID=267362 RepID=A0A559KJ42_9MOLU|nr:ATP-binding cassette domain-containing protein [Candidatus Phytoplasma pini]TVY12127.1 methionine transport ATP-binding protein [Candidatus Phytoplasma pini]